MDDRTCQTCGALLGDEQLHQQWHASSDADPLAGDGAPDAAEQEPTTSHPRDAAPYSA